VDRVAVIGFSGKAVPGPVLKTLRLVRRVETDFDMGIGGVAGRFLLLRAPGRKIAPSSILSVACNQ
jgi:hypothetical protein